MFDSVYETQRSTERGQQRREMDRRACREGLWLAVYAAELAGWSDLSDPILNLITEVDRRRAVTPV